MTKTFSNWILYRTQSKDKFHLDVKIRLNAKKLINKTKRENSLWPGDRVVYLSSSHKSTPYGAKYHNKTYKYEWMGLRGHQNFCLMQYTIIKLRDTNQLEMLFCNIYNWQEMIAGSNSSWQKKSRGHWGLSIWMKQRNEESTIPLVIRKFQMLQKSFPSHFQLMKT